MVLRRGKQVAGRVETYSGERIFTLPNVLSFVRLAGVPLFLWLVLGPRADGWAVVVLAVSGLTDWFDGQLARRLGQVSTLGKLLDPLADRLYILAVLAGLLLRGIVPVWLVLLIVSREVVLGIQILVLRRHGYGPLPVHFLGKAATFCLLYAFPLLFLGHGEGGFPLAAKVAGWAFAIWGVGLYWWAGILYLAQARELLRRGTPTPPTVEGDRLRT